MLGSTAASRCLRLVTTTKPCVQERSLTVLAHNIMLKNNKMVMVTAAVQNNARPMSFSSSSDDDGTVLVLGSSGALGKTVSRHLGRDLGMTVIGADLLELDDDTDWELDGFIALPHLSQNPTLADLTTRLVKGVGHVLDDGKSQLNAIVVASGGWAGDPKPASPKASDDEVQAAAEAYGDGVDKMMRMNLHPVVAAGHVAERYMGDEGLFVVMGATAALSPTPGMMGYGLAKAAAHHFVQTLGASTGKSATSKPKRKDGRRVRSQATVQYLDTLTAIGILPTTIDTPANRVANPKGDFEQWTKPLDIAKEIGRYIEKPLLRPHSGALIKVFPTQGGGSENGATFHLVR